MLQHITHILLDAARMEDQMEEAKQMNAVHDSLYRGGSEESLSAVAPYIFRFAINTPFCQWYMEKGWGDAWGVMLKSSYPMPELHKHFRKFLLVKTEDGEELYFRFYDPRVLRIFLPTCDAQQIREFFGPVDYFLLEDEDPAFIIRFWQENGILKTQRTPLEYQHQVFETSTIAPEETVIPLLSETYTIPVAPTPPVIKTDTSALDEKNSKNSKWNMFD